MISDIRSLKISMQVLGILYITPTTTLDDKLKTFLSISINRDSISTSKYSRSGLFINFISFLIYKDTPPPRRCFLERFIQLYLSILYRSCLLWSSHVSVRAIIVNSSCSELIYISSSSKCLGILFTFKWKKDNRLQFFCSTTFEINWSSK